MADAVGLQVEATSRPADAEATLEELLQQAHSHVQEIRSFKDMRPVQCVVWDYDWRTDTELTAWTEQAKLDINSMFWWAATAR